MRERERRSGTLRAGKVVRDFEKKKNKNNTHTHTKITNPPPPLSTPDDSFFVYKSAGMLLLLFFFWLAKRWCCCCCLVFCFSQLLLFISADSILVDASFSLRHRLWFIDRLHWWAPLVSWLFLSCAFYWLFIRVIHFLGGRPYYTNEYMIRCAHHLRFLLNFGEIAIE